MSTRELRHLKMRMEVDLNVPLCTETREQVAARSLVDLNVQRGGSVPCHPIDLEATDDDDEIVVSSPTEFAEVWFAVSIFVIVSDMNYVCLCGCPHSTTNRIYIML